MTFDVSAPAYGRFMGRYSEPLAAEFLDWVDVRPGQRALDVGCGPGALTARLAARLGTDAVAAAEPSESFVAAVRSRLPGVDVRCAAAEQLPFEDGTFDAALAQLVVHFMAEPATGISEMARVTRPGGRVAACVWDQAGGRGPLAVFWRAVTELDPQAEDESRRAGVREGDLARLLEGCGLRDVRAAELAVRVGFSALADWWEPYTLGVGPAGAYVERLGSGPRHALRARCAALLPPAPFEVTAVAWTAVGTVPPL